MCSSGASKRRNGATRGAYLAASCFAIKPRSPKGPRGRLELIMGKRSKLIVMLMEVTMRARTANWKASRNSAVTAWLQFPAFVLLHSSTD